MIVLQGIWKFVVGDDWRSAAGVFLALAATALLEAVGLPAWWACPLAAIAILYLSVSRVTFAKRRADS